MLAAAIALSASAAAQTTWYVDDDAPAGGDGRGWDTAFRFLQDALAASTNDDTVRVAAGRYPPDRDRDNPDGTGRRTAVFLLDRGRTVLGGYAGLGAEDPDARDIATYETVLTADLAGDDGSTPDSTRENAEQVVRMGDRGRLPLLEGVTISATNGRAAVFLDGGTLRFCTLVGNRSTRGTVDACECGTQQVIGCAFINNYTTGAGGAISGSQSAPLIEDCLFIGNSAVSAGAVCAYDISIGLTRCTFIANEARTGYGGAVRVDTSSYHDGLPRPIRDCLFLGNRAALGGGAIAQFGGGREIVNCVFIGNRTEGTGGAIHVGRSEGALTVSNSTFTENVADSGGAMFAGAPNARLTVHNSIVWRHEPDEIADPAKRAVVRRSIVRGGWTGSGSNNSSANPRFERRPAPGPDGTWGTDDDDRGDLRLALDSPGIDAGSNDLVWPGSSSDHDRNARFVEVPEVPNTGVGPRPIVDIGAYERQVLACARCTADLNCDDAVTLNDLCLWHRAPCDVNRDEAIDARDAAFIAALVRDTYDDCNANDVPDACEGRRAAGGLFPPEELDAGTAPAVAIGTDLALLGANLDDEWGTDAGAVFVFQRDGDAWSPSYKLPPPGSEPDAEFGRSVAIDGTVAVVGAHRDDEQGSNAGAAYVYRHEPFRLVREAKLLASDGANGDNLGRAVAAAADAVIVSAHRDDDARGAAYVYRLDGGAWSQHAKLTASDRGAGDRFGIDVAIAGDVALVGADRDDDRGEDAGAAYVFRRDGDAWVQEQKLLAPDGEAGDAFGDGVAIEGDVAAVGAHLDDDVASNAGAVWIFRRDAESGVWLSETKLMGPDGDTGDLYGRAVALRGGELLVGARQHNGGGGDAGALYMYRYHDATSAWRPSGRLDGHAGAMLGASVDLGAGLAIASTHGDVDEQARLVATAGAPDTNENGVPDDCECPGDVNGDGVVGFEDVIALLAAWGPCPAEGACPADLDADERVGFNDLVTLLGLWGPCP